MPENEPLLASQLGVDEQLDRAGHPELLKHSFGLSDAIDFQNGLANFDLLIGILAVPLLNHFGSPDFNDQNALHVW
eukprot:CAMPEP_0114655084 /NCGR_PEP_ID=MMETSP0191-20121206/10863_1 /TAXON_ID=126664 /ORGANISM="Sorites sp." /LENGTH=75 /DNA_ID=CAMNT_0001870691 /DNA_START=384 /DNA_END=608 /DNA_ORIENTATION=-